MNLLFGEINDSKSLQKLMEHLHFTFYACIYMVLQNIVNTIIIKNKLFSVPII